MALAKKSKIRDPSYKVSVKKGRKNIAPITLNYRLAQSGEFTGTAASGVANIDLAQSLSIVNRKLYRQGMCYYVAAVTQVQVFSAETEAGNAVCEIQTLPNSWEIANSWVMAYASWSQMRKQVLEETPSIQARWADFKILFDKNQYTAFASGVTNPLPQVSISGTYTPFVYNSSGSTVGEWELSEFTLPDHTTGGTADSFYGHMMGPDDGGPIGTSAMNSFGMLEAYEESRTFVQPKDEPSGVSTSVYSNLFDLGGQQADLTDDIIGEGEFPPYDQKQMGNILQANSGNGITQAVLQTKKDLPIASTMNGFAVPCGLLKVNYLNTTAGSGATYPISLLVTLVPGKYHGVHAEPMGQ